MVVVYDSFLWGFDGSGIPDLVAALARDTSFYPWLPMSAAEEQRLAQDMLDADVVLIQSTSRDAPQRLAEFPIPD